MEHLAQCLATLNPELGKTVSRHSSGFFHIPTREAAEPRCARMTFGFRLGTLPAKPGPSWNLLGQDLLQTMGLGRWDTPNLLSKGRKLSNGRIPDPGTGLPWGPWGRSHTELSESWESSRRQWAWWGMAGFRHSPHTYHLHMVPLGILKQVSAGFQRRSEPEAQAAQRVGVLSGNAENHPEEGDTAQHLGRGRKPTSPTPTTSSLVKRDEPSWLRAIQPHKPRPPSSPCTASQPLSPVQSTP